MKTINDGLPEDIYLAIKKDHYEKGDADFSITELQKPPQMLQLEKRYDNEIKIKASDCIRLFSGNCFHDYMEESNRSIYGEDALIEARFFINILDKKISGKIDFYKDGVLSDYKETSVWKYIKGDYSEWEQQLNLYAYLLSENNINVEQLRIKVKFYDWKPKDKLRYGKDYPEKAIIEIPITLWDRHFQKTSITREVNSHLIAENTATDNLSEYYPCSSQEMWEQPTTYAVIKKGNKKATKVFNDYEEAKQFIIGLDLSKRSEMKNFEIEIRPGKRVRCEDYCIVNKYCNQFKEYKK